MTVTLVRLAAMVAPLALCAAGCNKSGPPAVPAERTPPAAPGPATEPAPPANAPAKQDGDAVNVDVNPGGGVNVDVEGEPIRDRIRERRAERAAETEAAAEAEAPRPTAP